MRLTNGSVTYVFATNTYQDQPKYPGILIVEWTASLKWEMALFKFNDYYVHYKSISQNAYLVGGSDKSELERVAFSI